MANNRMLAVCMICAEREDTRPEDYVIYLAKYYPSMGWQHGNEEFATEMGRKLEAFFMKHDHETLIGDYIHFTYESRVGPAGDIKTKILTALAGGRQ